MASQHASPYKPNREADGSAGHTRSWRRWPVIVGAGMCIYYAISALTLPFADDVWFGEVPPLAIIQLPKSFLKSVVHDVLMSCVSALGLSRGSFSPDFIATHGWAMGIMTTAPALLLVAVFLFMPRVLHRRKLIAAILICASIDTIVTLWFDSVSNFKLYNASYF